MKRTQVASEPQIPKNLYLLTKSPFLFNDPRETKAVVFGALVLDPEFKKKKITCVPGN